MNNADMPAMPVLDESGMPFNDTPKDLCTIGLTKREQACITLCLPETGDEELDAIIRKAQRAKIATAAMQRLNVWPSNSSSIVANLSVVYADDLLAELERTK